MRHIERAYEDEDIRMVLLVEIACGASDEDAAREIGIKAGVDFSASLISHWVRRLNILPAAREARDSRDDNYLFLETLRESLSV